jgi:predicted transcriptional regulator
MEKETKITLLGENTAIIENEIIKAVSDQEPHVRIASIKGLYYFPSEKTKMMLSIISTKDEYIYKNKKTGENKYPVREEAQKILDEIKNTEVQK